jgi:hypothetical protein
LTSGPQWRALLSGRAVWEASVGLRAYCGARTGFREYEPARGKGRQEYRSAHRRKSKRVA